MDSGFWWRCVQAGCAVVPVRAFSKYRDGNTHPDDEIGILYAAIPISDQPVGPDFYLCIEEAQTGADKLFANPTAALESAEKWKKA